MVDSPGDQPYLWVLSQCHFININLAVMERSLLWITRHLFLLYGSEGISGTKKNRTNIMIEDTLIAQEIPRICGAMS